MLNRTRPVVPLIMVILATGAFAGTLVVDDDGGPGVDFTDIPEAIAAAVDGDVIVVNPGNYSGFLLSKGLTILGAAPVGAVRVGLGSVVNGLTTTQRAVLVDMRMDGIAVHACAGAVVLDSLSLTYAGGGQLIRIDDCDDVRLIGVSAPGPSSQTFPVEGLAISGSRVEVVGCDVSGSDGLDVDKGAGPDGADGSLIGGASRVHFAGSSSTGGAGGSVFATCPSFLNQGGGDGGRGIFVSGGSLLYLMGEATDVIKGGFAGCGGACPCDGFGGTGLDVTGATVRYSGVSLLGGDSPGACTSGQALQGCCASQTVPPAPHLQFSGTPGPGMPVTFTVHGEPGGQVFLRLGRNPVVNPTPGILIEQLTIPLRNFDLGLVPPSGQATFSFTVPALLSQGFTFYAQGEVFAPAATFRTNSVPVTVR